MTMKINSLRFLFLWLFLVAAQSSARKNHAHGTSVIHQHGQRPLSRNELAVISQTRNNNSPAFESDSRVFLNTVVCVATLNLIINLTRPDPSVVWQVSKKYLWSIFVYTKLCNLHSLIWCLLVTVVSLSSHVMGNLHHGDCHHSFGLEYY